MERETTRTAITSREATGSVRDDSLQQRLITYDHRWTGRIDKNILAKAGFFFTGVDDKVECPSCGLKLLNWTPTDDPLHEHATRRPLCSFINSRYRQLGQNKPPKHPQYQELQARLDSFVGWPGRFVPKTPEELAAAGFFYIGSADRVTCFQCGITLRDWEEEHDPVTEHQRYSENCQFINKTDLNQLGVSTRMAVSDSNQMEACGMNTAPENIAMNQTTDVTHQKPPTNENQKVDLRDMSKSSTEEKYEASPATVSQELPSQGARSLKQASRRLAEENQRLRQRTKCTVCRNKTVSILFLPCGHLVTCSDCAPRISECVVCAKKIAGTVRVYFS